MKVPHREELYIDMPYEHSSSLPRPSETDVIMRGLGNWPQPIQLAKLGARSAEPW